MSGAGIRRVAEAEKETSILQLPENIKEFIERTPWTFAKTYAKTWPHEYIVTLSPFFGQFRGFLKVDRKPASRDHFIHFGV